MENIIHRWIPESQEKRDKMEEDIVINIAFNVIMILGLLVVGFLVYKLK